jgi:hypothetical protein
MDGEELQIPGSRPNDVVAARTGRTANAVRPKRAALGIPNPGGGRWTAEEVALLGTLPDGAVARRLGRSPSSVTQKRIKLGIPNRFDRRRPVGFL